MVEIADTRLKPTTVAAAMHRGVIKCSSRAAGRTVARIIAAHRVHSVVAVDDEGACSSVITEAVAVDDEGACSSVITEAEIVAAASSGMLESSTAAELGEPPVTIEPNESIRNAATLMFDRHTTHLVVIDPITNKPLGVLSVLDIVDVVAEEEAK